MPVEIRSGQSQTEKKSDVTMWSIPNLNISRELSCTTAPNAAAADDDDSNCIPGSSPIT